MRQVDAIKKCFIIQYDISRAYRALAIEEELAHETEQAEVAIDERSSTLDNGTQWSTVQLPV